MPIELAQNVCKFLPLQDLLSLRLVSRNIEKMTVYPLSKVLAWKLEDIQAIVTEDGLRALQGLCEIEELRRHMKSVTFVNPESCPYEDIEASESTRLRNTQFEASPEAHQLLTQIFKYLSDAPRIEKIELGYPVYRPGCDGGSKGVCGFKELMRSIKQENQYCLFVSYYPCDFKKALGTLLRSLRDSGFAKPRVVVNLQPEDEPQRTNVVSIADARLLSQNCIQDIAVDNNFHPLGEKDPNDSRWIRRCLHAATQVESLHLRGCERIEGKWCSSCDPIFTPLYETSFPRLSELRLQNMRTTQDDLLELIEGHTATLRSLSLFDVHIKSHGIRSWKPILQAILRIPQLERLRAEILSVIPGPGGVSSFYSDDIVVFEFGVEGRDEIIAYIHRIEASI
jgi:hypothetical protein